MHIVVKLFLPLELKDHDEFVDDLIKKMDKNKDGKIGYNEFVNFVRETGNANIFSQ